MLTLRTVLQTLFTAAMLVVTGLTFAFVVPLIWLKEALSRPRSGPRAARAALAVLLLVGTLVLAGCDASDAQQISNALSRSVGQAEDFAASAPPAPYRANGDAAALGQAAKDADLTLTGQQLALVKGAAASFGIQPQLLAYVAEQEQRHLDEGEDQRDVLGALAGEDTSVGLAQIKVSTAREVEKNDQRGLFPAPATTDVAVTERVRRLAADDWNLLYAVAYLALLHQRFPSDQPLDLATRYTGATPGSSSLAPDEALYEQLGAILEK
ncbi:MAG: hypothetical protein U0514_02050 [Candidatus Andersenbacteria bacterium]